MEMIPYEAQTAVVSFAAALLIGGAVALLGARTVAGAARFAAGLFIKRRIALSLGAAMMTGGGAVLLNMLGGGENAVAAPGLFNFF